MRAALLVSVIVVAAAAAVAAAVLFVQTPAARAVGTATLHVTGLDVGKHQRAIVRLHNTSAHASDVFAVHYTIYALDTLNGNPVALSQPGAGDGAQLIPGDTLELDLGAIIDAYRVERELGEWDAPIRFVAFGAGGNFERFGPATILATALQTDGGATFAPAVTWTADEER